jgi:uncharacterized membrane protein (UPF0127 family)
MRYFRLEHNRRRLSWVVNAGRGPAERAVGLLWNRRLDARCAFLLEPCRSVHTFGMRFPIDVLFCDAQWRVVELLDGLAPWRIAGHKAACAVWELPTGSIRALGLRLGDDLRPC